MYESSTLVQNCQNKADPNLLIFSNFYLRYGKSGCSFCNRTIDGKIRLILNEPPVTIHPECLQVWLSSSLGNTSGFVICKIEAGNSCLCLMLMLCIFCSVAFALRPLEICWPPYSCMTKWSIVTTASRKLLVLEYYWGRTCLKAHIE